MAQKFLTTQALQHAPVMYRRLRRAYYCSIGRDVGLRRLIKTLVRPELVCVDVGAFHGVFVDEFVRTGAIVVAFEPNAKLASILRRMFRGRATIFNAAVSNRSGSAKLRIPTNDLALATIEPKNPLKTCPEPTKQIVRCVTLDSQKIPPVGFIKIDVEGHELAVLEGSDAMIRRDLPIIMVEAEDRHRPGAVLSVWDYLTKRGYRGYAIVGGQILDFEQFTLGLLMTKANVRDFLFLPCCAEQLAERPEDLRSS